jgi:Zinc knuckle
VRLRSKATTDCSCDSSTTYLTETLCATQRYKPATTLLRDIRRQRDCPVITIMVRDTTEESMTAPEGSVRLGRPVGVPEESEYHVDTPDQGQNIRRETLYQQADEEADDPTWEEILAQWKADPRQLYTEIVEVVQNLRDLGVEHQQVRARLKESRKKVEELTSQVNIQRQASVALSMSGDKTVKLPDPPKFSGKTATGTSFEHWLVQVKNKLRGNHDHFQTEDLKVIYVSGLLEGDVLALVTSRLDPDNAQYYTGIQELYTHLTELYGDPNRVKNARTQFKSWFMKKDQTFQVFYATFLRLVADGDLPKQGLKDELNDKLAWDLQEAVAVYYNDPAVNIQTFAQYCTTLDQQIKYRAEKRDRGKRNGGRTQKPEEKAEPPTGPAPVVPPTGDRPRRDRSTVKCYQCNKLGHYARECSEKDKIAQVEDSGKAQP